MKYQPKPLIASDSQEAVLERILTTLEQTGPMDIEVMIDSLQLLAHPAAEKVLNMAMQDGMIEPDEQSGGLKVSGFGLDVAKDVRHALGVTGDDGGTSKR